MRLWMKSAGLFILISLAGGLTYGLWPFVDRSAPVAKPVPMPEAPLANTERLTSFIESGAIGVDAFVIHKAGAVAFEHGPVDVPMNLASARKSVLSLLYGIAWDRGLIDLSDTIGELGIDERSTPLTQVERQATIENLLQARSGVYLISGAETVEIREGRPRRGQYAPGENYFYNNWDFNVLGAIFEAKTGMRIGDALEQWLARPLGMEDFHPSHVYFDPKDGTTDYPTYRMHMSARDMARLGTLILQNGAWNGNRIVSEAWLSRSFTAHSTFEPVKWSFARNGFGYSWWLATDSNAVIADGWGGQFMYVDRENNMVFVTRRDTGNSRLGFVWFQLVKRGGEPRDLMTLREMVLQQLRCEMRQPPTDDGAPAAPARQDSRTACR